MAGRGVKHAAFKDYAAAVKALTDGDQWPQGAQLICLYGTDDLLLAEASRRLKAKAANLGCVVTPVEAASITENSLLGLVGQTSLFEPETFYVLNRGEAARSLAILLAKIKSPVHLRNRLCLICQSEAPPAALAKELKRLGALSVPCFAPWPNELPAVLTSLASSVGLKLAPDALQLLMTAHGQDLVKQLNELRKVALIIGPQAAGTPLPAEILAPHLEMLREDEATALDQLLLKRAWPAAQLLTTRLLERGEKPLTLLAVFTAHCRTSIRLLEAMGRGTPAAALASATRLPPFLVKSYLPYLHRGESLTRFIRTLTQCQAVDLQLKSQRTDESLLLAQVIAALAAA